MYIHISHACMFLTLSFNTLPMEGRQGHALERANHSNQFLTILSNKLGSFGATNNYKQDLTFITSKIQKMSTQKQKVN
eukprot:c20099_g1_i1 orf=346-579(+)